MTQFVVDNSVVMKWYVPETHGDHALRLAADKHELHAPELLVPEFSNAIRSRVRSGTLSWDEADLLGFQFRRQPVELHPHSSYMSLALGMAIEHNHPAYDCFYLALAMELRCKCVTADRRFYDALSPAYEAALLWVEDIPA